MKLLFENWRKYLNEDWRDTSWETDDEKVTIGQVVDYLGDETVDLSVLELSQQLPELPTRGAERVAAASLDYPIIVVKSGGQYRFVLDGNHRLQKAINEEVETIKAKILDLDNPETPEVFQRMFGAPNETPITKLRVFDFDDTLTHATARIVVRDTETGEEIRTLNQGELDTYEETEGEELDYSEFKEVPEETRPIEKIIKIFRNMVEHPDKDRKVMIITARMAAAETEIEDYLENLDIDLGDVEIVGTEGESKAPYIQRELEGLPSVNNFIMFDDSEKNLVEVRAMLKENFPDIEVKLRRPTVEDGEVKVPIFRH